MRTPGGKYAPRPRIPGIMLNACMKAVEVLDDPFTTADIWREAQNQIGKPLTKAQAEAGLGDCVLWLRQHGRIVCIGAGKYIRGARENNS